MPQLDAVTSHALLSAMITPAVLISACGTLIFSTSTRLARNVDRVRGLARQLEALWAEPPGEETEERVREVEGLLATSARRSHLIQRSLTSFYVALGLFVGATVAVGMSSLFPGIAWVPGMLGLVGTLVLFLGSVQLIRETRLAMEAVDREMRFVLERGARRRVGPAR